MSDVGTLTNTPVLTINPKDYRLAEFRKLVKDSNVRIEISEVSGFGRPELSLPEGYMSGRDNISEFIQYVGKHKHYRPFLDRLK